MKMEISSFQGPKQTSQTEEEEESSEEEESASEYSSSQAETVIGSKKMPSATQMPLAMQPTLA
jgi:hypothetical protein